MSGYLHNTHLLIVDGRHACAGAQLCGDDGRERGAGGGRAALGQGQGR